MSVKLLQKVDNTYQKAMTSSPDAVTELLITLLGETSFFFKLSAQGTRIVVIESNVSLLPSAIALKVETFAEIATNVRNLELWRRSFSGVDVVKRAHIESVCAILDAYLNEVDSMRMNHISGRTVLLASDVLAFATLWCERVYFVGRVADVTREMCGVDSMNAVYREWCRLSLDDWIVGFLENSLRAMSSSFHALVSDWLLDGRIPPGWMFRDPNALVAGGERDNLPPPTPDVLKFHNIFPTTSLTTAGTTVEINSGFSTSPNHLEIDWARVPFSYGFYPMLIRKLFSIGKNVLILREFRLQKVYEYRMDERMALLNDSQLDKTKVWYDVSERGRFMMIIQRYEEIIAEDVMRELLDRQHLLDHIAFIQKHFLLLYGDFTMGIYEAIRETPVGDGASTSRLSVHRLDSMVIECVRYALNFADTSLGVGFCANLRPGELTSSTASAHNVATTTGLVPSVFAGSPVPAVRSTNSTSHKSSLKRRALLRAANVDGLFLEDLVRISYRTTGLISEVLNSQNLKVYTRIFETFIPLRVLYCRINESVFQLSDVLRVRRRLFYRRAEVEHGAIAIRITQFVLANVNRFVASLLSYVFDEVLESECTSALAKLRAQTDLPGLYAQHKEFIIALLLALFLHRSTQPVFDALRQCIKGVRCVLRRVDAQFTAKLKRENEANGAGALHKNSLTTKTNDTMVVANDDAEFQRAQEALWTERKEHVCEAYTDFLKHTLRLRASVRVACASDAKQSPHWRHFEPCALHVPSELLRDTAGETSTMSTTTAAATLAAIPDQGNGDVEAATVTIL